MVNGKLPPRLSPRNLRLQRPHPRIQLVHRQPIDVLRRQQSQRGIGPSGEKLVDIHGCDVDLVRPRLSISGGGQQGE